MPGLQNLASRSRGVFLGAAVGDALGWPQEQNSGIVGGSKNRIINPTNTFHTWDRYSGSQYQKYIETVGAGEYSDDTQLILATARAVLTPDWFAALTDTELPLFLLYQRGAGGATLRACRSWAAGSPPWLGGTTQRASKSQQQYFSAGGNGVAMRIAPHVIVRAAGPRHDLVAQVTRNGVTTHGHPRALVGAAVYAAALHILLTAKGTLEYGELLELLQADDSWQIPEIAFSALPDGWLNAANQLQPDLTTWWETTINETKGLLSRTATGMESGILGNDLDVLEALGCFDKRINGAGTITAVGAIYLASRNAPRPQGGLVRAAFLKRADTDTMASMTAGLLGALHGPDWLEPLGSQVQDRDYIASMADQCTSLALGESRTLRSPAQLVREHDLRSFREQLETADHAPRIAPDGRLVESMHRASLASRTKAVASRRLLNVEGQTMVVDLVQRNVTNQSADRSTADDQQEPAASATVRRISILASEPDAIEAFYGPDGLGLPVSRLSASEVLVDRTYRFIRPSTDTALAIGGVYLEVQVDDLETVLDRLQATRNTTGAVTRLKDPAGNDVGVFQRRK
ncbi:ADP-ribosylglycohydrolase [Lentzea atacamensis]|uniref:ADP-ribosylglycohydrolase n=1 Tax=Lentzea atacamensis TaxID=531938 RepID=A0A316IBB8_9PSEU|nr:ADP-ribosylglycohydrolase family protein [Lentzea atacamensis]PWK84582.1 ADP-ribosylglycohydrolase [Lentzea atacamensis]